MSKRVVVFGLLAAFACCIGILQRNPAKVPTLRCVSRFIRKIDIAPCNDKYVRLIRIDDDSLIVQSLDLELLEISDEDGSIKWRRSLEELSRGQSRLWKESGLIGAGRLNSGELALLIEHDSIYLEVLKLNGPIIEERYLLSKKFQMCAGEGSIDLGNAKVVFAAWPAGDRIQPPDCYYLDLDQLPRAATLLPKSPALGGYCHDGTVSPDGQYGALAVNSVFVWRLASNKLVSDQFVPDNLDTIEKWKSIGAHGGYRPLSCAFSPDSTLLVVAAGANLFAVFETSTGKCLRFVRRNSMGRDFTDMRSASFLINNELVIVRSSANLSIYHIPSEKWVFNSWDDDKLNDRMHHLSKLSQIEIVSNLIYVLTIDGEISCFEFSVEE